MRMLEGMKTPKINKGEPTSKSVEEVQLNAWLNQPNVKLLTAGTYGNSAENMEEFVSHMDWKINYSGSDQFKVVFADESFGLRGVDARSPTLELKLLIFLMEKSYV